MATTSEQTRRRWLRITATDVRGALWSLVSTAAGLGLAIALLPGASATTVWAPLVVALLVGIGDVLARPLLRRLALRLGALGALVSGIVAQLVVAWLALTYVPGIWTRTWADVVWVLVAAGAIMAVGRWVVGASDREYVLGDLLRRARRNAGRSGVARGGRAAGTDPTADGADRGLLIVQLDGVSRTTLDHALQAGLAPRLARWLSSGSHLLESWWARVPSTTPASQAGLLHGTTDAVPAFRWWDRAAGRLVVSNRPADAAVIEARLSDGCGLLADGGVAVSTMFSGDASTSLLVMSRARSGLGPGQMFVRFFASPFVLVRALVMTAGEFFKELYQAWQQSLRGVLPRVSRLGAYPVLRAVSNVILRDLNTSLVAEQLVRGAPVVFVDLVDYDEIAHHAGPMRPESLRSLEGLDRVIGLWEQVAEVAPRRYDIVVLSDHGQSLGSTFEQEVGRSFAAEVRRLMALPAAASANEAETPRSPEVWGSVNTALNAFGRSDDARVLVGPDRPTVAAPTLPEVAVVGSGNLGMIWFPRHEPLDGPQIRSLWPALIPGLVANPAVGVVVERSGPELVVHGAGGTRFLVAGTVAGDDPLLRFGPRAASDLLRVARLPNAGDLILLSSVNEVGMVHAFEGLVGSHGGLGGAQNEAILLYPASFSVSDDERSGDGVDRMLVGAEAVHRRLLAWLVELGIRPPEPAMEVPVTDERRPS